MLYQRKAQIYSLLPWQLISVPSQNPSSLSPGRRVLGPWPEGGAGVDAPVGVDAAYPSPPHAPSHAPSHAVHPGLALVSPETMAATFPSCSVTGAHAVSSVHATGPAAVLAGVLARHRALLGSWNGTAERGGDTGCPKQGIAAGAAAGGGQLGWGLWACSCPPRAGQRFRKGSHHGGLPWQRGGPWSGCGQGRPAPKQAAAPALLVGPQESGHFGAQQLDEGPREHLLGLLGCVLEVVLGVRQHVEEGLDQLLVLQGKAGRGEAEGPGHAPLPRPGALTGPVPHP